MQQSEPPPQSPGVIDAEFTVMSRGRDVLGSYPETLAPGAMRYSYSDPVSPYRGKPTGVGRGPQKERLSFEESPELYNDALESFGGVERAPSRRVPVTPRSKEEGVERPHQAAGRPPLPPPGEEVISVRTIEAPLADSDVSFGTGLIGRARSWWDVQKALKGDSRWESNFYRRTGIAASENQATVAKAAGARETVRRAFGRERDALEAEVEAQFADPNTRFIVPKLASRIPLEPAEAAAYKANPQAFDSLVSGFDRVRSNVRSMSIDGDGGRALFRDRGPSYFPHRSDPLTTKTRRGVMSESDYATLEPGELKVSADYARSKVSQLDDVRAVLRYIDDAHAKISLGQHVKNVIAKRDAWAKQGKLTDVRLANEHLKKVEGVPPEADTFAREMVQRAALADPAKVGDAFVNDSGSFGYQGAIEVVGEQKLGAQRMLQISVDGEPKSAWLTPEHVTALKHETALLAENSGRLAERWLKNVAAFETLAFNGAPVVNAAVGNTVRVGFGLPFQDVSRGIGTLKDIVSGSKDAKTMAARERLAVSGFSEPFASQRPGAGVGSFANDLAYGPLQAMDKAARVVAFEGAYEFIGRTRPGLAEHVRIAEASDMAAKMVDIIRDSDRAPNVSLERSVASWLQGASERKWGQLTELVARGQVARAASMLGVEYAAMRGIYEAAGGDPEKVKWMVFSLPYVGLLTSPLSLLAVPAKKFRARALAGLEAAGVDPQDLGERSPRTKDILPAGIERARRSIEEGSVLPMGVTPKERE